MTEVILAKCGEIVLKGLNRRQFESLLLKNTRAALKDAGEFEVTLSQSIVYVEPQGAQDMDAAFEKVRRVFGFAGVARAVKCEKDMGAILNAVAEYLPQVMREYKTFKAESKRSDKRFPLKSPDISREVGGAVLAACPHLKAEMHHPDVVVMTEIRDSAAYLHAGQFPGAGGMPYGSNGVLLLSGGIDSPVAAYMIAKRGVKIIPLHFFSPPYTGERAKQKVVKLTEILKDYCPGISLRVVYFTDVQKAILENCREDLFTVIMRRFMMRIAWEVMRRHGAGSIVTGESLGQVASQTMQALSVTDATTPALTLRPLIGMDKEEIVKISRRIGTFETSIEPYEDCCTVFTPRHPKTKPELRQVEEEEKKLDVDALVRAALDNIEIIGGYQE